MRNGLAVCLLLGVTACAQPMSMLPASSPIVGETMVSKIPPGFQQDYYGNSNGTETTHVPIGESLWGNWTALANVQFERGKRAPSATEYVEAMAKSRPTGCTSKVIDPVVTSVVNGYPAATLKMTCLAIARTGKSETVLMRAVRGNEGVYAVQYVARFAPDEAKMAEMTQYMESLKVCDTRLPEHPCPFGKSAPPTKGS
jgi:hypothetical protein